MREITGEITLQIAKLDKTRKHLFTFGSHQVKHGGLGGGDLEMFFKYGTKQHLLPKCKI